MALLEAGLPIVGGILGQLFASGDKQKATDLIKQMTDEYGNVNIPGLGEQQLNLDQYSSAGDLSPQQESAVSQGASELSNYTTAPGLRDAEMGALDQLRAVGNEGGLRLGDKLALQQSQGEINRNAKAKRDSIGGSAQARGRGGSGFSLAAQLAGAQGDAERASSDGMSIAANAQDRALQALTGAGSMAGRIRGADFNEASGKASAADAINRFNTANLQSVNDRNTNRVNTAAQYSLGNRQEIANNNVNTRNQQQMHNKGLYQSQFQNRMQLGGAKNSARQAGVAHYGQQAQQTQQTWGGMGNAAQKGLIGYQKMQKNKQEEE